MGDDYRCLSGITKRPPLAYNILMETTFNPSRLRDSTIFFAIRFSYQGVITVLSLRSQISFPSFLPPFPSFSRSPFFPPCPPQSSVSIYIASSYPRLFIMDISLVYTIIMGGSFLLPLLINGLPLIAHLVRYLSPLVSKHLIYRYILHRHRLLGRWSRADVLVQLIYIAGNICCFELGSNCHTRYQ
jgi:hypothetical protein